MEKPNPDQYAKDKNGEVTEVFEKHLREWEFTKLRTVFLEEIRILNPEWFDVWSTSHFCIDFYLAVQNCDNSWCFRRLNRWLDSGLEGSLRDILYS
jgi:hypothetical protein